VEKRGCEDERVRKLAENLAGISYKIVRVCLDEP